LNKLPFQGSEQHLTSFKVQLT